MPLNREDIILQIKDNLKYYQSHADVKLPGQEWAMAQVEALKELLNQIEEYDKFVSLDELVKGLFPETNHGK